MFNAAEFPAKINNTEFIHCFFHIYNPSIGTIELTRLKNNFIDGLQ